MAASLPRLKGAFAFAMIFEGEHDLLIGASHGAPLAVGFGEGDRTGEMFLGSDALALAPFTDAIAYLEDGDFVALTHESAGFTMHGPAGGAAKDQIARLGAANRQGQLSPFHGEGNP